jgi:hypothetical protein
MTDFEQYIYNCYLSSSRKINNKPFKYRKNFDEFEKSEDYGYIFKLNNFFSKFKNINVKDFFDAPFYVYNEKYFDLKFYTSQKAIKSYTIYQNKFLPENPDHDKSVEKIKLSFEFIYNFCKEKNITFNDYCNYTSPDKKWHEFLLHLKYRDICIYPLFSFPHFDKILQQYDSEIKDFVFGDTFQNINFYRTKYYSSTKAKKLIITAFKKLNDKLTIKEHSL